MQEQPARNPYQKFEGHTELVKNVIHLPGGQRVITCSRDGSLRVWNLESGAQIEDDWRDGKSEVYTMALSPDGKKVVSGSQDSSLRLWDTETSKVIIKWMGHTSGVTCVRWNGDGGRVMSGSYDGTARAWDAKSGKTILGPITAGLILYAVTYSPDETMIVTGGYSEMERIKIWDAKTGKPVANLKGPDSRVYCLAWTTDGKKLISGSADGTIRTWNATTWQQNTVLIAHPEDVCDIALSPNDRIIASASSDKTVRLWNLDNGQPINSPIQHARVVTTTSFSTDGKLLVIGCWDKNAYIWDVSATIKEAGLGDLLSDSNAVSSQNYASESVIDADATQRPVEALNDIRRRLPQRFFDDARHPIQSTSTHPPPRSSAARLPSASRPALLDQVSSLFPRSHCSAHKATMRNTPSSFIPLHWTRTIFSGQRFRRDRSNVELERRPPEVKVPCTRGLARNVKVKGKPEKKPIANNIMTINVAAPSQPSNSHAAVQQCSAGAHGQRSSKPQVLQPAGEYTSLAWRFASESHSGHLLFSAGPV